MLDRIFSELQILPVDDLLQHEETIPANLLRLKEAMLNIGQLVDPLIIDNETKTVLDGNHRMNVLKLIKCPQAVCQAVDYSSTKITLATWLPVAKSVFPSKLLKDKGFTLEKIDYSEGAKSVNEGKAPFMYANKSECYLVNPGKHPLKEYLKEQERILAPFNGSTENRFEYLSDEFASDFFKNGKTFMYRRPFTKDEVRQMAGAKTPFPPKSTRHAIPDRIIRLNMRLGWLHESKEEAEKYLKRMLEDRIYSGNVRRYTEPVIVIY